MAFDDSIVQDTTSEKHQDMDEVFAGLMDQAEYRAKRHRESREGRVFSALLTPWLKAQVVAMERLE